MRIVCPSCQAAYEVPDRLISQTPRQLRCARCGHQWQPPELRAPLAAPPPPSAASPRPASPPPPDIPAATPSPPRRAEPLPPPLRSEARLMNYREELDTQPLPRVSASHSGRVALLGWLLSLLVLLLLGGAAVAWRDDVMAAWPPSQRLYAALGLR